MHSILYIEDDPTITELMADSFSEHAPELKIHFAKDLDQFEKVYDKQEFSLVLLDYMIPGAYGTELLKRIKKDHPQLPVFMITSKTEEYDKEVAKAHGASEYFTKPVKFSSLLAKIKEYL